MGFPWQGAARPRSSDVMRRAAADLQCELAAIEAVFAAEASGAGFNRDGTLKRRFEPHHMPGAVMGWREAFKLKAGRRAALFRAAYARDPEAAARASSWGLPQIMGFNHAAAGYPSALAMVRAMAAGEDAQIEAFVALIKSWGLAPAIRAHDWQAFETRYNGGGQGGAYARKIEAHFRRFSGMASAEVLRVGSSGAGVRRLQAALGIEVDGAFGQATESAVRAFQAAEGLPVDGVVGARTWTVLKAHDVAPARVQPTGADALLSRGEAFLRKGGLGAGAGFTGAEILDRAPAHAIDVLIYGAVALALVYAGAVVLRGVRGAAR